MSMNVDFFPFSNFSIEKILFKNINNKLFLSTHLSNEI